MKRLQQTQTALGSRVLLTLVFNDKNNALAIFKNLWRQIINFEQRFSRFRIDSELSQFNSRAGNTTKISKQFHAMLRVCQEMSLDTAELFNPFILPNLQQAGYVGSWPNPQEFTSKLDYRSRNDFASINKLTLLENAARIPRNSAIDFGGIGKGYLLDELNRYLLIEGYKNYWLSIGGDIICSGNDLNYKPWSIGIQKAIGDNVIDSIENLSGLPIGIATSGITNRKGPNDNKSWHHIIDPRSGKPTNTDLLTATITAASATRADVYAKCLVILGTKYSEQFIENHHIQSAYLQLRDGKTIIYGTKKKVTT